MLHIEISPKQWPSDGKEKDTGEREGDKGRKGIQERKKVGWWWRSYDRNEIISP
jgi:hypothetical protein